MPATADAIPWLLLGEGVMLQQASAGDLETLQGPRLLLALFPRQWKVLALHRPAGCRCDFWGIPISLPGGEQLPLGIVLSS